MFEKVIALQVGEALRLKVSSLAPERTRADPIGYLTGRLLPENRWRIEVISGAKFPAGANYICADIGEGRVSITRVA